MTGADIVAALLIGDPAVTAVVPTASIKLGRLPDNVSLPAYLVRVVSSVDRQTLKRGATVRVTDRVSVTVRAASYRDQVRAIKVARRCCAGVTGSVNAMVDGAQETAKRVSILTAGKGPDVNGPADSFEQAQDFRVSFDADA